jgi:hypothetical protein
MSTANLDSADLKAIAFGGLIREDVMNRVWDISRIPLPFTDMIGSDSVQNSFASWVQDRLSDPDLDNAVVDGADSDQNNTNNGPRVGNHAQTSTKEVRVSSRADASNSIGNTGKLAYQVMMRQRELRRDVEAISLSNQASVADDGDTTAGRSAGLAAWLTTNVVAAGTTGGFNTTTGVVDAYQPAAAAVPLTEDSLKDVIEQVWAGGGDPTVIMGIPAQIRRLNEYMFSSSARIATLQGETSADGAGQLVAKGSVNVYVSDHGNTLSIIANRLQPTHATAAPDDASNLFILDPDYLMHGYLYGYRVEPLAKTGLSEKRLMSVDWMLKVANEEAHGMITDLDFTAPVTAS